LIAATRNDDQTRVRVDRPPDTVVVLGSGSDPVFEVNVAACRADGIPILRRRGGGCSVVLDPGNVIVSVTATGLPFGHHRRQFDALCAWLIEGLSAVGIPGVRQAGISDLAIGDRKVSGAAIYRSRDLLYYSATLLVEADIDRIERYLQHPPREPDYRAGRSHRDFVTNLTDVMTALPDAASSKGEFAQAERWASILQGALSAPRLRD
jgi:lipoate-protein ligase A